MDIQLTEDLKKKNKKKYLFKIPQMHVKCQEKKNIKLLHFINLPAF